MLCLKALETKFVYKLHGFPSSKYRYTGELDMLDTQQNKLLSELNLGSSRSEEVYT